MGGIFLHHSFFNVGDKIEYVSLREIYSEIYFLGYMVCMYNAHVGFMYILG